MKHGHDWLRGKKIAPPPIGPGCSVRELVDSAFLAYNGARLREACRLYVGKMLEPDVTVGLSLSGALTPAGIGRSCLVPLIENGMVDWIVSTGAILYHDTHFALGMDLHLGSPFADDRALRKDKVIRIYDVLFSFDVLLDTDRFYRRLLECEEFQQTMGTAQFHYLVGKYLAAREKALDLKGASLLVAAYRAGVPVYTSSPGDSSIGMNMAYAAMRGNKCQIDPLADVNETAAIVYDAARNGKSAVLGIEEKGHSYFLQVTDARPDTGGLSGATPSEAVSWGKVDPDHLPDAVVCYLDTTVALPILTAYALDAHSPRPLRRLFDRRGALMEALRERALTESSAQEPNE
jgi:deoxyhypusine synthase